MKAGFGMWDMDKKRLLEYMKAPKFVGGHNRMGCSEDWYDPYFAIYQTFSIEEVENMSETEVNNLLKLAQQISEGLY